MKLIKESGTLAYRKNIVGAVAKILITSVCSQHSCTDVNFLVSIIVLVLSGVTVRESKA